MFRSPPQLVCALCRLAGLLLLACDSTSSGGAPDATEAGTLPPPTTASTANAPAVPSAVAGEATPVLQPLPTPGPTVIVDGCLGEPYVSAVGGLPVAEEDARIAAPVGVAPAQPYLALQPAASPELEELVLQILGGETEKYGVVVRELAGGLGASVNADSVFYAASIFKLFVLFEVFNQADQDVLSLSDQLVISPYYESFGLGSRATELCQLLTVTEALAAMMSISDNAAAVLLQDLVGAGNINASLAALGLTASRLEIDDLPLTASDAALLLEAIGRGAARSVPSTRTMLSLLQSEQIDNGLRAGVPTEVAVGHKTGTWQGALHDIGIVFGPSSTYVVAILSSPGERDMIAKLSEAIYAFFNPVAASENQP